MEWISVEHQLPEVRAGKFRVRRKNGQEMDAFFYLDSIAWIAFYGQKTSHWWSATYPYDRLDDVSYWRKNGMD